MLVSVGFADNIRQTEFFYLNRNIPNPTPYFGKANRVLCRWGYIYIYASVWIASVGWDRGCIFWKPAVLVGRVAWVNIWPNRRFCARDPQCWVPGPRYLYVSGRLGLENINGDGSIFWLGCGGFFARSW